MQPKNTLPLPAFFILTALAVGATVLFLPNGPLSSLFSDESFQPHAVCFTWDRTLLYTFAISDTFIGLAYITISFLLLYLVHKTYPRIPFPGMFVAFGAFIVSCGVTHFMGVWTLWNPVYWLSAWTRVVTAAVSVATAVALPSALPRALRLVDAARKSEERRQALIRTNEQLQAEIKERNRAEAQLKVALEKERLLNEMQARFIRTMSHEFRTPLAEVQTASDLLIRYNDRMDDERRTEKLTQIQSSVAHLNHVLDDILTVRDIEIGQGTFSPIEMQLAEVVNGAVQTARRNTNRHTITLSMDDDCGMVHADEAQLKDVLDNLLSNAVKYSPDGGEITVGVQCNAQTTTITVQDDGIGIPEAEQQAVFETFFRGKDAVNIPGTGLGLSIVRSYVDRHGGSVSLDSTEGVGTTVTVTLPKIKPSESGES